MTFSMYAFYAEPTAVVGESSSETRQLWAGIGSEGNTELVAVGIFDEGDDASIYLNRAELQDVIEELMELRNLMDGIGL